MTPPELATTKMYHHLGAMFAILKKSVSKIAHIYKTNALTLCELITKEYVFYLFLKISNRGDRLLNNSTNKDLR